MELVLAFATTWLTSFLLAIGSLLIVLALIVLALPPLRRRKRNQMGRAYPWITVMVLALGASLVLAAAANGGVYPLLLDPLSVVAGLLAICAGIIGLLLLAGLQW